MNQINNVYLEIDSQKNLQNSLNLHDFPRNPMPLISPELVCIQFFV